ncbi:MAG: hypothetical protein MUD12_07825 [Spirochaetes bacterium]|jgi:hypothetical protein|nr:hypothetical protein [Spirochaetota bacterium]
MPVRFLSLICTTVILFISGLSRGGIEGFPDPLQTDSSAEVIVKQVNGGRLEIKPLAEYRIQAMIIGIKYYAEDGDRSLIAPVDLALAWGRLVDPEVDGHITYTQSGRWYYFRWIGGTVDTDYIYRHSANNHIIPADDAVLDAIKKFSVRKKVLLQGYLVEAHLAYPNGRWFKWKSSLTRNDTGDGSCEVFYVKSAAPIEE